MNVDTQLSVFEPAPPIHISYRHFFEAFGDNSLPRWRKLKRNGEVLQEVSMHRGVFSTEQKLSLFYCKNDTVYMELYELDQAEQVLLRQKELESNAKIRMGVGWVGNK